MNKKELEKRKIAYFTMEVGIDPKMPTYSGGLGILAGGYSKILRGFRRAAYCRNLT